MPSIILFFPTKFKSIPKDVRIFLAPICMCQFNRISLYVLLSSSKKTPEYFQNIVKESLQEIDITLLSCKYLYVSRCKIIVIVKGWTL